MDKFVTVTKPARNRATINAQEKSRTSYKYNPFGVSKSNERKFEQWNDKKRTAKILAPLLEDGTKPSASALTKHLLTTLSDEKNPITHSDSYLRADHITSAASGHQRGEGRGPNKGYWEARSRKLEAQLPAASSSSEGKVLYNVKVYIDGYLDDTTDIEMKRIVKIAGGEVRHTASGATHILTSQQLSASKTHKLLTTKSKIKVHVIRPEWVTDSINAGMRLPESAYAILQDKTVRSIADMFSQSGAKA